ncbi:MAG: glycosyltransferase family 4 protein [candidate division WOR-3 bacterium]
MAPEVLVTQGKALHVCLVSAAYRPFPSGVSEHVYHLKIELERIGHSVRVLTCNYPGQSEREHGVTRLGRVVVLPANSSRFTLPFGHDLPSAVRGFLRDHHFDVVHCHGMFPPEIAYWAIKYSRAPVVVTFHTLRQQSPSLVRSTFRILFRKLLCKIGARIAVTQAGQRWAEGWVPGDYEVIPNGVDTARFSPSVPPAPVFRDGRPALLYVGRIDRRKGLPVLIRSLPDVIRLAPDVKLVVVGSGPLEASCRRMCRRFGFGNRVLFCGTVSPEELPSYYSGCTIYVSPALGGEAMGIVLLEAMASGKPVVASRIPGYDEVVAEGRDALLVSAGDPTALGHALIRLLESPMERARLSENALRRAQEFNWPRVAARVELVYEGVLA